MALLADNECMCKNGEEGQKVVYNSARDGRLLRLKSFLQLKPKVEAYTWIHAKTNGATPLIVASRNGHQEVVKYFVEKHNIQIEQVGSVIFDGETIEGAPPLWCAAAAGHLSIVKYLVEHGANVNKTTQTNSTPLRAACFDGHIDVVKYLVSKGADIEIANRHGHTCLMISCYKKHVCIVLFLLNLAAQVNRKSIKGNTALHDCAEAGSLEIMKLLLQHRALMTKDHYMMTPLMASAVAGFQPIVEYLIERKECTIVEKVDALELLGATFIDRKRDNIAAMEFWVRAMQLRYGEHDPLIKPPAAKPIEAYDYSVEAKTAKQLKDMEYDPDEMRMQALLVRERILGPSHPDTSYYIRYRGALYADMGNVNRCISLWLYALEMQQNSLEALSVMTQSSFLSFAELFCFMDSEWRQEDIKTTLNHKHLLIVLEGGVQEMRKGVKIMHNQTDSELAETYERSMTHLTRLMKILLHLLILMMKLEVVLDCADRMPLKRVVYKLVKEDPRGLKNNSLLHLACMNKTTDVGRYPICKFPNVELATLLIEVGADVNARNSEGDTPLHMAAKEISCNRQIIKLLIENGSHIDAANRKGEIAADLVSIPFFSVVPLLNFTTLQCLASREIVKNKIPYKGIVGFDLEKTVAIHEGSLSDKGWQSETEKQQ